MSATLKKTSEQIRTERLRTKAEAPCGRLMVACLWPKKGENLGTLGRSVDAVNACMVVPYLKHANEAIRKGNTIGPHICLHRIPDDALGFLQQQRDAGYRIVGVELAAGATPLQDLSVALGPTLIVLGHEAQGIPKEAWHFLDEVVEIPMRGVGNSLNVAVAGSLVLYKLAGLS